MALFFVLNNLYDLIKTQIKTPFVGRMYKEEPIPSFFLFSEI